MMDALPFDQMTSRGVRLAVIMFVLLLGAALSWWGSKTKKPIWAVVIFVAIAAAVGILMVFPRAR